MAVYDEKMRSRVVQELAMEAAMADALRKEEFEMYLQPQISLKKSGVLRAEAWYAGAGQTGNLYSRQILSVCLNGRGLYSAWIITC